MSIEDVLELLNIIDQQSEIILHLVRENAEKENLICELTRTIPLTE